MSTVKPFQFLDLPKDIRLIVYERLPRQIKHHHVIDPSQSEDRFVLITRCLPVAILSTCKFINSEATNIVRKIQNEFILSQCPHFIANRQLFFQTGFMSVFKIFPYRCFAQGPGEGDLLADSVRRSLQALARGCFDEAVVKTAAARFNAQSCRQIAYQNDTLGPDQKTHIRFMILDDVGSAMGWDDKLENCAMICRWFNVLYLPERISSVVCNGFLPADSYTSLGFTRDVVPTLIDVRCWLKPNVDIRELTFDERAWRSDWME